MAAIKTSKVIPLMVIAFVLMAAFVFFKASGSSVAKPVTTVDAGQWMRSAPTPRTSDADTSNDTIRAIRGEVTSANSKADETLEMNKKLIARLDDVMTEKAVIVQSQDELIENKLKEQAQTQSSVQAAQFDKMMSKMEEMVLTMSEVKVETVPEAKRSPDPGDRSGSGEPLSIPEGFGLGIEAGQFISGEDLIEVFWIEPLDESINNRVIGGGGIVVNQASGKGVEVRADGSPADNAKAMLMKPLDTYRDLVDGVAEEGGVLKKGQKLLAPAGAKKMSSGKASKIVEISAAYRGPVVRQTQRTQADSTESTPVQRVPAEQQVESVEPTRSRVSTFQTRSRVNAPPAEKVFTIPDLSVLAGAIATTSLVGRIYPDGNVVDPQFFKLIVGRENFTANFNELPPEIEGMIFEGFGIGDFTTRCISGRLIAATFIFEDGSTRSIYPGDPGTRPDGGNSLGYITDPYGNPCVGGRLITDAKEFFATGSVLAFASAYANGLRDGQLTTVQSFGADDGQISGANQTTVTGDINEFALASGAREGIDRAIDFIDEQFQASRSLIYAPSGMSVDIHLQQELRLDIAANARKIRYRKNARRQNDLD